MTLGTPSLKYSTTQQAESQDTEGKPTSMALPPGPRRLPRPLPTIPQAAHTLEPMQSGLDPGSPDGQLICAEDVFRPAQGRGSWAPGPSP